MKEIIDCPNCGGDGFTIETGIEPICCYCPNEDGSCCGNPEPNPVPIQEQCEMCKATGKIKPLKK